MAQFHISGRPRPARVQAVLEPGEAPVAAAAGPGSARARFTTQAMALPPAQHHGRSPAIWLAAAVVPVAVIAAVVYFRPQAQETQPKAAAAKPAKPAKTGYFTSSKPVVKAETWTYGRKGAPPRQTVPSPAALAAYKNEMERIAEKQKKSRAAMP